MLPNGRSLRVACLIALCGASPGYAQTFAIQVGPPVAAMPDPASGRIERKVGKDVVFVLRSTGCEAPQDVSYAGTAETRVGGVRRSWSLPIGAVTSTGVVGAVKNWADKEPWLAVVTARCGQKEAGALVRIGNNGYGRDAVELLPRRPVSAEVERALARLLDEQATTGR